MKRSGLPFAVIGVVLLVGCQAPLEPTPPSRADMVKTTRTIPAHELLPGTKVRTALLFAQAIPGSDLRAEVREYYISEGNEIDIAASGEALCEIRSGRFDVTTPEAKGERMTGTIWTVAPGDRVAAKTTSEMAILRCTYIVRQ